MAKIIVVKSTGIVSDVIPSSWFEGSSVADPSGIFATVNVSGMPPSDPFFERFRDGEQLTFPASEHITLTRSEFLAGASYGD